jgi:hypothetical protein
VNIFSPKLLTFYGVSTVGAIGLFVGITNYGEIHLKAAPLLVGSYRLETTNLPGCLKARSLQLTIQQSGIYLSGTLEATEERTRDSKKAETKSNPLLAGNWKNNQLTLTGQTAKIQECAAQTSVILKAEASEKTLKGTIELSGETSSFVATRLENSPKPSTGH